MARRALRSSLTIVRPAEGGRLQAELLERIPPFWRAAFAVPFGAALVTAAALVARSPIGGGWTLQVGALGIPATTAQLAGVLGGGALAAAGLRAAFRRTLPGTFGVGAEALTLPGVARSVAYGSIDALECRSYLGRRFLFIGCGRGRAHAIGERRIAEAGGVERLERELRAAIAASTDHPSRIGEVAARSAAFAQRAGLPVLSVAFAALIALVYRATDFTPTFGMAFTLSNIPVLTLGSEPYRALTAPFAHADLAHLAANLVPILLLGPVFERAVGWRRLLLVGLAGGVASSAVHWFVAPYSSSPSIGASGACFAWVAFVLASRALRGAALPPRMRLAAPMIVLLAWIWMAASEPGPSRALHLAGVVAGVALAPVLMREGAPGSEPSRAVVVAAIASIPLAFAWAAASAALRGERALTIAMQRAAVEERDLLVLNDMAWRIATDRDASSERLALALRAAARAVELDPSRGDVADTLATLLYRCGEYDRAIEAARAALVLDPHPFVREQLARFELARARRTGPIPVAIDWEPAAARATARPAAAHPNGVDLRVVALRDERIAAAVEIAIGAPVAAGEPVEIRLDVPRDADLDGTQLVVTAVTPRAERGTQENEGQVHALEGETADLP
jgi:membrane associated rhomboid family serine protease